MNAYDDYDRWKSGEMSNSKYAGSIGLGALSGAAAPGVGKILSAPIAGAAMSAINEGGRQLIHDG